jgi:hypothetical protein
MKNIWNAFNKGVLPQEAVASFQLSKKSAPAPQQHNQQDPICCLMKSRSLLALLAITDLVSISRRESIKSLTPPERAFISLGAFQMKRTV